MSSVRSARPSYSSGSPTPVDLVRFLPYACAQLRAPFFIRIIREIQGEITSIENHRITLPFQQYLNKILIYRIPFQGICVYELATILPVSQITEISLEDSRVPEGNYSLLLEQAQLKILSLARCMIDDDICVEIASKLIHPLPASTCLLLLSLKGNLISDVGAQALGHALRSNRTLQYLNLAGNRITNIGASGIFNSLKEFYLTYDELFTKRIRLIDYLKLRQQTYEKCLVNIKKSTLEKAPDEYSRNSKRRGTATKSKSPGLSGLDYIEMRAEMMVNEIIGTYFDPFTPEDTVKREQLLYSIGNMSLCYLNLSYNNLGYSSVVNLANLLKYQSTLSRPEKTGLLRVVIEGNELPHSCEEYGIIEYYLERVINSRLAKSMKRVELKKMRPK
ncbi:hypothetical protein K1T71_013182 [Dendrolimus kikuchii]|uniref:Uncharacterized protein n=1 Tax=Dendrolimus kikuchii TaxID=765133 RepID=A0ACC1CJ86_9NEOP|nr:hypothetical protein K1T71_013182 [Dendrolimus kikuchii]